MFDFEIKIEKDPVENAASSNMSIIDLTSPSTNAESDSNHLVEQCEILLKKDVSKYKKYIKHQEELRVQLAKTNGDFKHLRSCMEKFNEDCFAMKPNHGHLIRTYELLLKDNFVKEFIQGSREQFLLKFYKMLIQSGNLKASLSSVESDISSLKLKYEELFKHGEVFLQTTSTKESHEYANRQGDLRLKSIEVIYECERLELNLDAARKEIMSLNLEHGDLRKRYQGLLQNTIYKEFLIAIGHHPKSVETFEADVVNLESSRVEEVTSRLNELEKKLQTEQQRREQIENEYSSLNDFSDKLCRLFLKHQHPMLRENITEKPVANKPSVWNSVEIGSLPSDTNKVAEFSSSTIIPKLEEDEIEIDVCENSEAKRNEEFGVESLKSNFDYRNSSVIGMIEMAPDRRRSTLRDEPLNQIQTSLSTTLLANCSINLTKCDPFCDVLTTNSASVAESFPRLRKRLARDPITKLDCDICGKYFMQRKYLNQHKRYVHEGHTLFKCSVCGKMFTQGSNLKKHTLKVHASLHSYKCSICQQTYKDRGTLKMHEQFCNNPDNTRNELVRRGYNKKNPLKISNVAGAALLVT